MNPEYERELEQEIDREFKSLRELKAPSSLVRLVMSRIEDRQALKWYNQPWQYWPMPLRIGALVLLSVMFGGLCIASWRLTRAAGVSTAIQEVAGIFSGLNTLWNILNVLLDTVVLLAKHLGTGFLVACVAIAGLGYALCVGLGTAWVRLAFARR